MEITIAEYGRMMFDIMNKPRELMPAHWASISEEAIPLVKNLLDLHQKMIGNPYTIVGYMKDGKPVRSNYERICEAQEKTLQTEIKNLKIGDEFVYDFETPEPFKVLEITDEWVYSSQYRDRGMMRLKKDEKVLKIPENEDGDTFLENKEYWLKKADELGI